MVNFLVPRRIVIGVGPRGTSANATLTSLGFQIEGIDRPRAEPNFVRTVINQTVSGWPG